MDESQLRAQRFQRLVGKFLQKEFGVRAVIDREHPNSAVCNQVGGDGGRDFEVTIPAEGPFTLFGVSVQTDCTCFVEAKYVGSGAIDFARAAPNLSRIQHSAADRVFVVTNAHFAPSAQVSIYEDYRALKGRLHLIEGRAFKHWCDRHGLEWPDGIVPSSPAQEVLFDHLAVEANNLAVRDMDGQIQVFTMAFRNLGDEPKAVELVVTSDVEWLFSEQNLPAVKTAELIRLADKVPLEIRKTLVVPPWQSQALQVRGRFIGDKAEAGLQRRPRKGEAEDGARIVASIGDHLVPLYRGLRPIRVCFKPDFAGQRNIALKNELAPLFEGIERGHKPPRLQFLHIDGPAGVGKSRLVDEFLPLPQYSHILILHHTVEAGEEERPCDAKYWAHLRTQLKQRSGLEVEQLKRVADPISLIDTVVGPFQKSSDLAGEGAVVLVIEDVHNASEALCNRLLQLVTEDHALGTCVFVVVTARNDDSFVNPHYRWFSAGLAEARPGKDVLPLIRRSVAELEDQEAKEMIGALIEGIQPAGIDRIFALSGAVPHHIVQCIEYLLDAALVAVTIRDTLSIVDLRTFELRTSRLPQSMADLLAVRFENLGKWRDALGPAAQEAVLAATVFGTRFPLDVCSLINGIMGKELVGELTDRRFFRPVPGNDDILQWHHENLYLYFDGHRRANAQQLDAKGGAPPIAERFVANAEFIRACTPVWSALDPFKQGDVATLVGDLGMARSRFTPIIAEARRIQTFATLDTSARFFDHIEYVVAAHCGEDPQLRDEILWRLIVLKSFIGAYYKGLRYQVEALGYGMNVLPHLHLSNEVVERCRRWLRTIDAQVHLDSGFVGTALDRLMHLIHLIRMDEICGKLPQTDFDMLFDMHNTLRLLFCYANFTELARYNGELAERYRQMSGATALEDMDLGDLALFHMLTDRALCIELLEKALAANEAKGGTQRHAWHSEASLIASQLVDHQADTTWLRAAGKRASAIISECENAHYHSILPRLYLLCAVFEYLLGRAATDDKECEKWLDSALATANRCRNACEAFSIGFISWQVSNLRAVIHGRRDEWGMSLREMKTALEQIRKEGLLFMGTDGLTSSVPIVLANYIKLPNMRDSNILGMLASLHGFEAYGWALSEDLRRAKHLAKTYYHIIPGHERRPDWLIVDDRTDLAVVCWF